jgi:Effector-associated domain 11
MKVIKIKFKKPISTTFDGVDGIKVYYPFSFCVKDNLIDKLASIFITGCSANEWGYDAFSNESRFSEKLIKALFYHVDKQLKILIKSNDIILNEHNIQLKGISTLSNESHPDISRIGIIEGREIIIEIEETVGDYVKNGKISELFDKYTSHKNQNNDLILLESRYTLLENDKKNGLVKDDDYRIEYAKIVKGLLEGLGSN